MGRTLYFSNNESRSCWPVRQCVDDPVTEVVWRKSGPYRNNFQTVMETSIAPVNGVFGHTGKMVFPGKVTEIKSTADLYPTALSGFWVNGVAAVEPELNDEAAGRNLRQSGLQFTHWKVAIEAAEGNPSFCLISMDQYPDGYSLRPPNWWTDPTPDQV